MQDYEINEAGLSTFSLYSDDDDDEDDDEYYGLSEGDREGSIVGSDDNPFAPAEMYLSDLIDVNAGGARGHAYVPDNLVYSSPKHDPLYATSLKSELGELLSRHDNPEGMSKLL